MQRVSFFSYLDGNAVGFLGVVIGLDRRAHHYRVIAISIPQKEIRLPAACIQIKYELMSSRSPTAALRTYRSHLERTAESLRSKVCSDII